MLTSNLLFWKIPDTEPPTVTGNDVVICETSDGKLWKVDNNGAERIYAGTATDTQLTKGNGQGVELTDTPIPLSTLPFTAGGAYNLLNRAPIASSTGTTSIAVPGFTKTRLKLYAVQVETSSASGKKQFIVFVNSWNFNRDDFTFSLNSAYGDFALMSSTDGSYQDSNIIQVILVSGDYALITGVWEV